MDELGEGFERAGNLHVVVIDGAAVKTWCHRNTGRSTNLIATTGVLALAPRLSVALAVTA